MSDKAVDHAVVCALEKCACHFEGFASTIGIKVVDGGIDAVKEIGADELVLAKAVEVGGSHRLTFGLIILGWASNTTWIVFPLLRGSPHT